MEATDGKVEVLIKEGAAMGTCEAPKLFAIAFKKPVLAWNMQGWREAKPMWMKARWMERKVDCSTGVYADDIIKKHLVESGRAEEAMQIVSEQSKRLTEHLQRSKLKQNQDKNGACALPG